MISIAKAHQNNINEITEANLQILKNLDFKPSKDQIIIKPNLVDAVPPDNPTITHPHVVEGLVLALHILFGNTLNEYIIAENSGYFSFKPEHFDRLMKISGYTAMIERLTKKGLNIKPINLEFEDLIEKKWKHGIVKLPALCKTHSYINVPKMKTHMMTGVTLSLKNQKGLLLLGDKKKFHLGYNGSSNLHDCILEFGSVIQPELTIVDATTALEGTGPAMIPNGQTATRELNLLIGGTSMVEVDNACCKIMGISASEINHIPESEINVAKNSLPIAPAFPPFKKPDPYIKIGNVLQYCSSWGCTNCQMAFSRMVRKSMLDEKIKEKFIELNNKYEEILFYIGKQEAGYLNDEDKDKPKIYFGTCTHRAAKEEPGGLYVKGCPADHNKGIETLIKLLER